MNKIVSSLTVALGLVAGPAGAQSRVEMQMEAELRMLQEQTQQLALTLAQIGEALKAINGRIEQTNENTRKGFADSNLRINDVASDVKTIREGTQDTNTRLNQLREEVEAMRSSLVTLPSLIQQAAPAPVLPLDPNAAPSTGVTVPPAVGSPAPVSAAPPPAPSSTFGLSPDRMYNQALADYQAGQYGVAISGFESFLRQFPSSTLADDAYVHMGESYFLQNKFEQAIDSYNKAIQNFPKGDALGVAYYKRGLAYSNLQQNDAARASWEQLIKLYPNTNEAILAKNGLDRISRQQAPARP